MKNYYIFLLIDGIPFLELILDSKKRAINGPEQINWDKTKYILLEFKTEIDNKKIVTKGFIKDGKSILTNKLSYFEVNVKNAHKIWQEENNIPKIEKGLIELSEKLFFASPDNFLRYMKQKRLFSDSELEKYEEALHTIKAEKEMLSSWNIVDTKYGKEKE